MDRLVCWLLMGARSGPMEVWFQLGSFPTETPSSPPLSPTKRREGVRHLQGLNAGVEDTRRGLSTARERLQLELDEASRVETVGERPGIK